MRFHFLRSKEKTLSLFLFSSFVPSIPPLSQTWTISKVQIISRFRSFLHGECNISCYGNAHQMNKCPNSRKRMPTMLTAAGQVVVKPPTTLSLTLLWPLDQLSLSKVATFREISDLKKNEINLYRYISIVFWFLLVDHWEKTLASERMASCSTWTNFHSHCSSANNNNQRNKFINFKSPFLCAVQSTICFSSAVLFSRRPNEAEIFGCDPKKNDT